MIAMLWLFAVGTVALAGCAATKQAPPKVEGQMAAAQPAGSNKMRWGFRLTPLNIVLGNGDYAKKYGLEIENVNTPAGPEARDALLAGAIDAGELGVTPALTALAQAPKDLVVIAVSSTGGGKYRVVVPKDSPIQTMDQLKGKKIAIKVGSGNHTAFLIWLNQKGLTEKDFQIVNVGDTEAIAAMVSKSVDAVLYWEPIPAILVHKGVAREIFNFDGFVQNPVLIVARRAWVEQNPDAAARFMAAWMDAQQFTAFRTDEAAKISADALTKKGIDIPAEVYRRSLGHELYESWFYPAVISEVRQTWDFLKKSNKVKGEINWAQAFDARYQAEGLKLLVQESLKQ